MVCIVNPDVFICVCQWPYTSCLPRKVQPECAILWLEFCCSWAGFSVQLFHSQYDRRCVDQRNPLVSLHDGRFLNYNFPIFFSRKEVDLNLRYMYRGKKVMQNWGNDLRHPADQLGGTAPLMCLCSATRTSNSSTWGTACSKRLSLVVNSEAQRNRTGSGQRNIYRV